MNKQMGLKAKLIVTFLVLGLVPMIFVGVYSYINGADSLKSEALAKTAAVTNLKKKLIEQYFDTVKNTALTLGSSEQIKKAMIDFNNGFNDFSKEEGVSEADSISKKYRLTQYYKNEFGKEYQALNKDKQPDVDGLIGQLTPNQLALQAAYIAENQNPMGSKHLLPASSGPSKYNKYHNMHHPTLLNYLQKFEFYDIFLIDAKSGNVVYSVYKELDFATSLTDGAYRNSGLASVFKKALASGSKDEVFMEDYSTYLPSFENPAGFVAVPVWSGSEITGVLAFQLSVFDKINSMLSTKSGDETMLETYLVGADFKMRSDTTFDKDHRTVKASFKFPDQGLMDTETIKQALKGQNPKIVTTSYLGKEAIIAAAPLKILGVDWAIETVYQTEEAFAPVHKMRWITIIMVTLSSVLICIIALLFGRNLARALTKISEGLRKEAMTVAETSRLIADVSGKLSEATTEQAASLQETVASIDEISAMVARNADGASASAKTSETTALSAQKGKEKIEVMLESINAIATGNDEIINQMQKSNKEISDIVRVIQEISEKTQVINDIVFQTKLLSFNASVEAARAGEHGKGFAVVAEEVGNLASMSGKAANEISEMLSRSVKRVTDIVEGTKGLMDNMIKQSKSKIEFGTSTAKECAKALDEILANVSSVNEMVREISNASHEQSTGVKEVNKAMSELDQVTQSNSTIAQESSHTAGELKSQAERLSNLVFDLKFLVDGNKVESTFTDAPADSNPPQRNENVVSFKSSKKSGPKADFDRPMKKAVGLDFNPPKNNDSRFEDV